MYILALLPALLSATSVSASPIRPRQAACTTTSFESFAWLARQFDFHASYVFRTPSHQNSWGYVSFDLFNPADQSTTHCQAQSNQLSEFFYGTVPYRCDDEGAGRSGRTSFDFDRATGRVRLNQTWTCTDQDPQWPITFTGRGEVNFALDCTETTYQNPNWTIGETYSSREIKCTPIEETKIVPFELSAVA
ncbi:hypothetical protein MMYC01_207260 [Madurella mycetomatis]|uniref:AA1-like domain-containing protein n=1 Tax=Madurella mycetomatis TaxID=100816 RepID=A0A175VXF7_9PEZI|nr:hypothetical protein MMYC01_210050 [Madurella mycetomatis]KXX76238.1 hypothetical protein MMYC01_207260 [Madurella mycetomatis]